MSAEHLEAHVTDDFTKGYFEYEDDDAETECSYELVMPFVTIKSVGGPHEDHSYAQGWTMGALDEHLPSVETGYATYVHPSNVPQADLIAMRHGFNMTTEPYEDDPDNWAMVTFMRVEIETTDDDGSEPEPESAAEA